MLKIKQQKITLEDIKQMAPIERANVVYRVGVRSMNPKTGKMQTLEIDQLIFPEPDLRKIEKIFFPVPTNKKLKHKELTDIGATDEQIYELIDNRKLLHPLTLKA